MTLLGTDAWREFLAEKDIYRVQRLRDTLVAGATGSDISDLVTLAGRGTTDEMDRAIRVLMGLRDDKYAAQWAGEQARWCDTLRRMVRGEYPRAPLGPLSFRALLQAHHESAERFILDELDLGALDDAGRRCVATDLCSLRGERAIARLREIVTLGGEAGRKANDVLAGWGVISHEKIRALAEKWRATHDRDALNRLYHVYFNHLAEGTVPIKDLVDLMGDPTRRVGDDLWYETKGACLFLEGVDGFLRGRKLN